MVGWCSRDDRGVYNSVSDFAPLIEGPCRSNTPPSPLDLTKVRLQASGDKRMIESMKKTINTAGKRLSNMFNMSQPQSLTFLTFQFFQASVVCLTVSREHGSARCPTPCADSGLTMKVRRSSVRLVRMPQLGSLLLLEVWVRYLKTKFIPLVDIN